MVLVVFFLPLFLIACFKVNENKLPIFKQASLNGQTAATTVLIDLSQTDDLWIAAHITDAVGLEYLKFCIFQIPLAKTTTLTSPPLLRDHLSEDQIYCEYFDEDENLYRNKNYYLSNYLMDIKNLPLEKRAYHLVITAVNVQKKWSEAHLSFEVIHK